jgi:hypothetical protein
MKSRAIGSPLVAVTALAVVLAAAPAAGQAGANAEAESAAALKLAEERTPIPRTPDGKPDLRGRWDVVDVAAGNIYEEHPGGFGITGGKSVIVDPPDGKIPYQPWALAERDRRRRPENAYEDNQGKCILSGLPRNTRDDFSIMYSPGSIVILSGYNHITRVIPMDGRPHLPGSIRLWMGDPRGRWEGATLIVETTNFNGKAWFALGGDFMSDAAQIVERFRMVNDKTMWWEATITDPRVFTRPWTMRFPGPHVKRGTTPEADEFDIEDSCHEGNVDLKHLQLNYEAAHGSKVPLPPTPPPTN